MGKVSSEMKRTGGLHNESKKKRGSEGGRNGGNKREGRKKMKSFIRRLEQEEIGLCMGK